MHACIYTLWPTATLIEQLESIDGQQLPQLVEENPPSTALSQTPTPLETAEQPKSQPDRVTSPLHLQQNPQTI